MADNFRTLVVVNPRSAGGEVSRKWGEIARTIEENYGPFVHRETQCAGDGARVAREAIAEGFELIVALGGDGTISEVASGFFDQNGVAAKSAALGVLPYGTGGDFRKTLGLTTVLADSAKRLRGRDTQPLDVGKLECTAFDGENTTRYFTNIASFGIGGVVDQIVNRSSKTLGGRATFFLATLRAQFSYKNRRVAISLDGGAPREQIIHNVAVANGRFFGGGMKVAPDARIDDGKFDVVTLGDFSQWELLTSGLRIYQGTHIGHPKVTAERATVVRAEPLDPGDEVIFDVDGETPGKLPATLTCLPAALKLKTPSLVAPR